MPDLLILAADLAAVLVLAVGVYYRRHRRRDLVLAFLGLNVGVLAVATILAGVSVGVGVGLGLFGVLSIIRLRSSEISQEEVAYYFSALAIGLICGLQPEPRWLAPALCAVIVTVIAVADHPALARDHRQQVITLDTVHPDERELAAHLEDLLGADVLRVVVQSTDLVRDLQVVDVRYRLRRAAAATPHAPRDDRQAVHPAPHPGAYPAAGSVVHPAARPVAPPAARPVAPPAARPVAPPIAERAVAQDPAAPAPAPASTAPGVAVATGR